MSSDNENLLIVASFADSLIKFRGVLIDEILASGATVHVAAPGLRPGSPIRSALEAKGCKAHDVSLQRAGMNPFADLATFAVLCCLMRKVRPDMVLAYTIKPIIYGMLAAWFVGVPRRFALVTGLGYAFTGEPVGLRKLVKRVSQRLYRLALSRCKLVFFQNPDDQALFRELGLVPASVPSQVVNGSGIDLIEFAPCPIPSSPHFLLIARLLGDKGVREYARASVALKTKYPHVIFSLAGWIDENPDAISPAELEAWIEQGINYLGLLEDVRPAIAGCSVYVLPSYREGTPRTVLEAMAMGRAIITTDAPGCKETVVDGENGYLVPVKSVDALRNVMERYIEDGEACLRMGLASRELAIAKYDVNEVNASILRGMEIGG